MKTLNISDETYELIKDQLGVDENVDISSFQDLIGKKWFFRTVTYHLIGMVTKVVGTFLILENAVWVADSGLFTKCLKNGEIKEVEICGTAFINLSTVTDFFPWKHDIPKERK